MQSCLLGSAQKTKNNLNAPKCNTNLMQNNLNAPKGCSVPWIGNRQCWKEGVWVHLGHICKQLCLTSRLLLAGYSFLDIKYPCLEIELWRTHFRKLFFTSCLFFRCLRLEFKVFYFYNQYINCSFPSMSVLWFCDPEN